MCRRSQRAAAGLDNRHLSQWLYLGGLLQSPKTLHWSMDCKRLTPFCALEFPYHRQSMLHHRMRLFWRAKTKKITLLVESHGNQLIFSQKIKKQHLLSHFIHRRKGFCCMLIILVCARGLFFRRARHFVLWTLIQWILAGISEQQATVDKTGQIGQTSIIGYFTLICWIFQNFTKIQEK